MEGGIVNPSVVTLEDVFDGCDRIEGVESVGDVGGRAAFSEGRDIPDADSLVLGGGDDEVFFRVELSRHNVVRVAGQHCNAVSGCAVPYSDGLVVRGRELEKQRSVEWIENEFGRSTNNPWHFVMELNRSDVIHMAVESEQASSILGSKV